MKDGGFYGWPYSYIGGHIDKRAPQREPELVKRAIVPDVLIPAHSAPLGGGGSGGRDPSTLQRMAWEPPRRG